jgi:hypothetical protein
MPAQARISDDCTKLIARLSFRAFAGGGRARSFVGLVTGFG